MVVRHYLVSALYILKHCTLHAPFSIRYTVYTIHYSIYYIYNITAHSLIVVSRVYGIYCTFRLFAVILYAYCIMYNIVYIAYCQLFNSVDISRNASIMIYIMIFFLYSVHCTVYSVECTLYTVHEHIFTGVYYWY